jgi:uncharacterized protein (DUF2147 family)
MSLLSRSCTPKLFASVLVFSLWMPMASTQNTGNASSNQSPVGLWKTVDDVTGKARSVVAIWDDKGKLAGRIQKLINPTKSDPRCDECSGALKGKPMLGMQILWGLQKDRDGWSGGSILDPESGKTYKCLVSLEDGGKKLKVRGFIGLALLGRTQYWFRE